jgi:hypothetical protein
MQHDGIVGAVMLLAAVALQSCAARTRALRVTNPHYGRANPLHTGDCNTPSTLIGIDSRLFSRALVTALDIDRLGGSAIELRENLRCPIDKDSQLCL